MRSKRRRSGSRLSSCVITYSSLAWIAASTMSATVSGASERPMSSTGAARSSRSLRCAADSSPPHIATPALLQSTCTAPKASKARAASACICARSATSVRTARALTPSACASPATAAMPASSRSATTTLAPSRANRWISARPIPLAPPVTTAVRPLSSTCPPLLRPRDVVPLALRRVFENRPEDRLQDFRVGGLAQESGEPGGLGLPHRIRARVAGQCDDRGLATVHHRRHPGGEVEALDAAQMEVEDHHARTRAADELERRLTRLRHQDSRRGQQNGEELAKGVTGIRIVFDDENRTRTAAWLR